MAADDALVMPKVKERIERSGLLEPGEEVLAYVAGQGMPPLLRHATGLLLMPLMLSSFRGIVLTDRHIYVCKVKTTSFHGGSLKSVRVKQPLDAAHATLAEARGRWRRLEVDGEKIYVIDRGSALRAAQAIVAAAGTAARLPSVHAHSD